MGVANGVIKITKFAKPKKPAKKAWYKRAASSVGNLFKRKNKPAEEAPDLAAEDIAAEGLEDVEADETSRRLVKKAKTVMRQPSASAPSEMPIRWPRHLEAAPQWRPR